MDFRWDSPFPSDIAFGYIGQNTAAPQRHNPRMVLNHEGSTVLHTLLEELKGCDTFTFSVAFVTPGAIALMIKELVEFNGVGRVITSDYLASTHPTRSLNCTSSADSGSTFDFTTTPRSIQRDTSSRTVKSSPR